MNISSVALRQPPGHRPSGCRCPAASPRLLYTVDLLPPVRVLAVPSARSMVAPVGQDQRMGAVVADRQGQAREGQGLGAFVSTTSRRRRYPP